MALARACAAMFLARLGSTRSWRLIALELGLPAWFAEYPPALHQRLVERGRWPAFLTDLDKLAGALEADLPPVDYRARRQLCAVPQRLFAAVRAGRLLAGDLPSDVVPDELLVRLFWQTYHRRGPAPGRTAGRAGRSGDGHGRAVPARRPAHSGDADAARHPG